LRALPLQQLVKHSPALMIEEYGAAAPLGLSIAVNFVVSPTAGVTAKLKKIIASARMMDS
jgi:hypothetical protein